MLGNAKRILYYENGIIMELKLTELEQKAVIYQSSINRRAKIKINSFPKKSKLKKLHINELRFNGINYISLKLEAKNAIGLQIEYSQPSYLVCFGVDGTYYVNKENCASTKTDQTITHQTYNLLSIENPIQIHVDNVSTMVFICIDIHRIQGLDQIRQESRPLSPSIHRVLTEIRECTEDCPIQCIFIESKILSLLHLIFEAFQRKDHFSKKKVKGELNAQDLEKLQAAKEYIDQNIAENYTLIELAHRVGLNDFKLKKGFKEVFGSTVFTYRHTIRMKKARKMLQSGYQVNEVSEEIGYKHSHHFSVAFKAYFNLLPSWINKG